MKTIKIIVEQQKAMLPIRSAFKESSLVKVIPTRGTLPSSLVEFDAVSKKE